MVGFNALIFTSGTAKLKFNHWMVIIIPDQVPQTNSLVKVGLKSLNILNMEFIKMIIKASLMILLVLPNINFALGDEIINLKSAELDVRENAAKKIAEQRENSIKLLIQLISKNDLNSTAKDNSDNPWHATKHFAILLLGDFRSTEAVSILVDNLTYRNPRQIFTYDYMDVDGWFPAVEALAKIGMPAIDPVIAKLATFPEGSQGYKNCCWIIRAVLGEKLGRYKLQLAAEEAKDPEVKQKLLAAAKLDFFQTQQEKADAERARRGAAAKSIPPQESLPVKP